MKIIISQHARERFKERWEYSEILDENLIIEVLNKGSNLSKSLLHTTFLLGYALPGYWTAIYKVYKEFIFIFRRDQYVNYILITIIHKSWLEKKKKQMIKDYYKQHANKNLRRKFARKKKRHLL